MNDTKLTRVPSPNHDPSCPSCSGQLLAMCLARLPESRKKIFLGLERQSTAWPPLLFRLLLGYEFAEAGLMKLNGENWFSDVNFPFPFGLLSADINWWLATGFEIAGPVALVLGWGTRFFSFALMVLTVVAISAVHWPPEWHNLSDLLAGYAITDQGHGNFKLPVLYLAMLTPLWLGGAGRWSLDHWFWVRNRRDERRQPMATLSGCVSGSRLNS